MNSMQWMAAISVIAATVGCGDSTAPPAGDAAVANDAAAVTDANGSAQVPPQGRVAVEAWIATGAYRSWHCEMPQHPARSPSPHGINRICTNDALSAHTGAGEYPVGSAAVKELYDAAGTNVIGYAVYSHVQERGHHRRELVLVRARPRRQRGAARRERRGGRRPRRQRPGDDDLRGVPLRRGHRRDALGPRFRVHARPLSGRPPRPSALATARRRV